MKKFFLLAVAAFALAACSEDDPSVTPDGPDVPIPDDPVVEVKVATIDFEAAELGESGYIWGKPLAKNQSEKLTAEDGVYGKSSFCYWGTLYSEKHANVQTHYTDWHHTDVEVWGGFVISNLTDRETPGYENDKSVYAESGAKGSKQFAIGYYNALPLQKQGVPTIKFRKTVQPVSVDVACATYTYLYYKNDIAESSKPRFDLVITGMNNRDEAGSVRIPMVENGKMAEGWKTVDISGLKKSGTLMISVECADAQAPAYFCIDNLVYKE